MSSENILGFHSRSISIIRPEGAPHSFRYRGFSTSEEILAKTPETKPEGNAHHQYVIFFKTQVESEAEVQKKWSEFLVLKYAIDAIWQFVFGTPYGTDVRNSTTAPQISGWFTNRNAVLPKLPRAAIDISIETQTTSVFQVKDWPLPRLLHAVDSYLASTQTLKFLMELHATALSMQNENIRFTLLGKLADLCETLLPGSTRLEKIAMLDPFFKRRLVFDAEIFRLANTRFETRHAAEKGNKELHPGMSEGEKEDFQSDVDTLVRALVFQHFGIQPVFHEVRFRR